MSIAMRGAGRGQEERDATLGTVLIILLVLVFVGWHFAQALINT